MTELRSERENEGGGERVLTIGHSTLDLSTFLDMLKKARVTAIADVRSSPVSRRFPHFDSESLRVSLKVHGIKYVPLGKELGGRPRANRLYCDGVADYEKMAREPDFLEGVERVMKGAAEHTIALMCSEHNPLDCHRCLLVGRALAERGVSLGHILGNGRIAEQHEIEEKLLSLFDGATRDMLDTRAERLANAYKLRSKNVAYRKPEPAKAGTAAQSLERHAT